MSKFRVSKSKPLHFGTGNIEEEQGTELYCFLLENQSVKYNVVIDTDNQIKKIGGITIDYDNEESEKICNSNLEDLPKDITEDSVSDAILNHCIPKLKPGGNIKGLNDVLLKRYISRTEEFDDNNFLTNLINKPIRGGELIDQIFSKDCHYSSFFTIEGKDYSLDTRASSKDYGLDTLGNKHAFIDGTKNLALKYKANCCPRPGVIHLNPFGLNYQNNSNACGIWSANILNQVQEFKKTSRENEIVKTYTDSDEKPYKILNPEILLRAAAQVSKDLTPEGQQPEIRILQEKREGQQVEKDYVPLKIGNTTFAIDTKYRPISCIDIEAIALSIPKEELSQERDNQNFIEKQEEIAAKVFSPVIDPLTKEQKERRERLKQVCEVRFTQEELNRIKLPQSQSTMQETTLEQRPLLPKPTSNPALKCFNFDAVKQELEEQRTMQPQPTPPKPQQEQHFFPP